MASLGLGAVVTTKAWLGMAVAECLRKDPILPVPPPSLSWIPRLSRRLSRRLKLDLLIGLAVEVDEAPSSEVNCSVLADTLPVVTMDELACNGNVEGFVASPCAAVLYVVAVDLVDEGGGVVVFVVVEA